MSTPEERALRARIAAHSLHAQVRDESAHTAPARRAFEERFYREVDPDGTLPPDERERRAKHARKVYFLRLSAAGHKKKQAGSEAATKKPKKPKKD